MKVYLKPVTEAHTINATAIQTILEQCSAELNPIGAEIFVEKSDGGVIQPQQRLDLKAGSSPKS